MKVTIVGEKETRTYAYKIQLVQLSELTIFFSSDVSFKQHFIGITVYIKIHGTFELANKSTSLLTDFLKLHFYLDLKETFYLNCIYSYILLLLL